MLLTFCAGNLTVTDEFPAQRPVTRIFDDFFDLHPKNGGVNIREASNFRHHCAHYDVTVLYMPCVARFDGTTNCLKRPASQV